MTQSLRITAVSLLALALAGCGGGGSGGFLDEGGSPAPAPSPSPGPSPSPSPSPTPTPVARKTSDLGINMTSAVFWSGERNFMNLVMGDVWNIVTNYGPWVRIDPSRVAREGHILSLAADEDATLMLTPPGHHPNGVQIRCTWLGTGTATVEGSVSNVQQGNRQFEFRYTWNGYQPAPTWFRLLTTDPADPMRSIDCREADAPRDALFAPEFINFLQPFSVLRFLDWQGVNTNQGGRWSERTLPTAMLHGLKEGPAIEHMVALANQANADPWFHMPFNADEEYVTKFAQLVHDLLPANRKVYVELSNEVWNYVFPATIQARDEGLALGLTTEPDQAVVRRYAQKASWVMDIWSRVFADRPDQLVRVLAGQSVIPWRSEQTLLYNDAASHFDVLATAPYFGGNQHDPGVAEITTVDEFLLLLAKSMDDNLEYARQNKALAEKYGLRHITYEAGQHVVIDNVELNRALQRSQGMYDLYRRYIDRWRQDQGDLMVLFNSTHPVSIYGSWGLWEFTGQPMADTPKRRAVLDSLP